MMDTHQDQLKALGEIFTAFGDALRPVAEVIQRTMNEWAASEPGQYLLAVAKYYDEHPEELNAMIAAREAEARSWDCHCLCQRWDHLGACTGDAATETTMYLDGDTLQVPMCRPCAQSVAEHRAALR